MKFLRTKIPGSGVKIPFMALTNGSMVLEKSKARFLNRKLRLSGSKKLKSRNVVMPYTHLEKKFRKNQEK